MKDKPEGNKKDGKETTYIKDKKTGRYIIVNPAGSIAYNYLYRNVIEEEEQESEEADG